MPERCVAEGRGERGCDSDEEDRWNDCAGWEDWSNVTTCSAGGDGYGRRGEVEVGVACKRGKCGLDCVEDDGEVECLGSVGRAICRCRDAFLEKCPG